MTDITPQSYSAFDGHKLLAQGRLDEVVLKVKRRLKSQPAAAILVFSDTTGKEMDFDLRGSEKEVLARLQIYLSPGVEPGSGGPGRPKLGVVAREVSLLPRHWEWLSTQSGGASITLRKLVEEASKSASGKDRVRQVQERAQKFMSAIAGNLPCYEEALRALYQRDRAKFQEQIVDWPADIRAHAGKLATPAFEKN